MSTCQKCYEAQARDTLLERVKSWLAYRIFGEHISDEKASSFTKGFGEGYIKGAHSRQNEVDNLSNRIVQLAMQDIGNKSVVDPLRIISQKPNGEVMLGTQAITKEHVMLLKEQAQALKQMLIWEVFVNTTKHQATELGFIKSKNFEETISGKTMVKNIEIMRDIIEVCSNLRVDK